MSRHLFTTIIFVFIASVSYGQKFFTKTGYVHFLSVAPLERIEATNSNGYVVLDAGTGQLEWSVLIKGFKFEKAVMQEHFNENYMESSRFPKAIFKGTLLNHSDITFSKDGNYEVQGKGDITIHGVTKPIRTLGRITIKNGVVSVSSSFDLTIADFQINVPKVVRDNIAKTVHVTVKGDLNALK